MFDRMRLAVGAVLLGLAVHTQALVIAPPSPAAPRPHAPSRSSRPLMRATRPLFATVRPPPVLMLGVANTFIGARLIRLAPLISTRLRALLAMAWMALTALAATRFVLVELKEREGFLDTAEECALDGDGSAACQQYDEFMEKIPEWKMQRIEGSVGSGTAALLGTLRQAQEQEAGSEA